MGKRVQFGLMWQHREAPSELIQNVREIEALGFDSLWVTDSSMHARDVWPALTLAAEHSKTLRLGTLVTNPVSRNVAVTLNAAASVDELSGGRLTLGLGAGDRPLTEIGLAPVPLGAVREMIHCARRLLTGEHVQYEGKHIKLTGAHLHFHHRADMPILMAASGPKALELAGELCDVVSIFAGAFSAGFNFANQHVDAGIAKAGRSADAVERIVNLSISVRPDAEQARREVRPLAAWFAQTAPAYCELAGIDPELIERIRKVYAGGEFHEARQAHELVTPEMVQKLTVAGTPSDCIERIEEAAAHGFRHIILIPMGDRMDFVRTVGRDILPHFA